ncbi:MAG TPA: alpha/beta hydrolase [Casimicrobiaceae bacterium]|nr:alpha/beta hydrolase [Casimicrobiaceae bacterium]
MNSEVQFIDVRWERHAVRIEYAWHGRHRNDQPLIVFLHEGLGSLAMWKDFPRVLCDAVGCRGLVFSRPGYGSSATHASDVRWDVDYLHRQAHAFLPAFLANVGLDDADRPWLFGHSDGGSIALLYASRFLHSVAGLIVVAPHVFVEPIGVASIETARSNYVTGDLRERLGKYHADVDAVFWRWNDIWLNPAFRAWNIEGELGAIVCPILAVQGLDDEYGTLEQVHVIARRLPNTCVVEFADCRHSVHKDQADGLIAEVARFIG